ncbi:hypothetical protein VU01_12413 [Candidatus Electrothrix marina]|uniref:Tetratricopeptide repeat-containing protein n=1 Tax=Candidatus Electrothrix marina TaxID=1859130 RepID=A0A444JD10_9BACT|nr:hypothetical protein VU01_12413 [Candidatus Electrothrix marina]
MSGSTEFLLYVTVYRLSVLAIGALSIYLGFRLFVRPPGQANSAGEASSAGVQAGEFKLRVTNFLPGIYFALFGTVLIGIMLWRGEPQLLRKEFVETKARNGDESILRKEEQYRLPEVDLDTAPAATDLGRELEKLHQSGMTLSDAAPSLSSIARIFQRQNRIGEAVAMARLAYLYGPEIDKAAYLSLFAELLEANGKGQEAADARAELEKLRQKAEGE